MNFARPFPKNVVMLDDGGVRPESIIGGIDGRTWVPDTTIYPYRASGRLTALGPDGRTYGCTAWLYKNNMIATAAHCIYFDLGTIKGWGQNFVFWPGRNGTSAPYGSCGWWSAHVPGFPIDPSFIPETDYGAIRLNCTVGDTTGWLGLLPQAASYTGTQVNIAGYPQDRADTMWQMSGPIEASAERQLFYSIDTAIGQNGSAVQMPGCGGYCAIAINAYGTYGGSPYNRGTRITSDVANQLLYSWSR